MVKCYALGARPPTDIEQAFFSGFPRMQSGMFMILCNTIFNYCNFNVYVYLFTCGLYIQIFLVWPFMPKNRNFNHSVWLILYSKPLDLKCMKWIKCTLCCACGTKINLFFYSAQLWAQKIGQLCSIEDARTLYKKYVCRNHFLETDFTTPERNRLNRGAVPCSSGSASQDPAPQLPDSWLTDLNSLPSLLSPQNNLHVQPPNRTCGKLPLYSSSIQTPLSVFEDSPCTSSQICAVNSTPPPANTFAVEDIRSI